jgi:predicted AAA+ superfamily ATPase
MTEYRKRIIDKQIEQKLTALGGILLAGARGVGKSTTAKHYAATYVSLDQSPQTLDAARIIPKNVLQGDTPRVIDEWQLAPELWNTARNEIDTRNAKGQFILTGSSSPTDNTTHHSGAGRFGAYACDLCHRRKWENLLTKFLFQIYLRKVLILVATAAFPYQNLQRH